MAKLLWFTNLSSILRMVSFKLGAVIGNGHNRFERKCSFMFGSCDTFVDIFWLYGYCTQNIQNLSVLTS
jgi:hypothetical protein